MSVTISLLHCFVLPLASIVVALLANQPSQALSSARGALPSLALPLSMHMYAPYPPCWPTMSHTRHHAVS